MKYILQRISPLLLFILCCAGCTSPANTTSNITMTPTATRAATPSPTASPVPLTRHAPADPCPTTLSTYANCLTPQAMRIAYGVQSLLDRGFTGKGQTVVDIVSFGSPTLQKDMDIFSKQFGLPAITIKVIEPIGTLPFNAKDQDMVGWAEETELDVQIIHAIAPDAGIVVLTSPVSETEGTVGLPEFLQLEQYAVTHKLGSIISQSWGASEVSLQDQAGQQEIQSWTSFFQQATTQQHITFFTGSGDSGVTDYTDASLKTLSPTPITGFPSDEPWVTSVGGTTLMRTFGGIDETAWSNSGGGFSAFFKTPDFQLSLPTSVQKQLQQRRGVPDIAATANPSTAMAIYSAGSWKRVGGTSASAPFWAALIAIANQMAGHPLGFINPALYKIASTSAYDQDFYDITFGNNSNIKANVTGYDAVPGWDPVTGLGSPNAEQLLPALVSTTT